MLGKGGHQSALAAHFAKPIGQSHYEKSFDLLAGREHLYRVRGKPAKNTPKKPPYTRQEGQTR